MSIFVSIPLQGKGFVKSSLVEPLLGEGLRPPNRHTSRKRLNFTQDKLILASEKLTGQAIDTLQRSYAVFKDRGRCVDEVQRTPSNIECITYACQDWERPLNHVSKQAQIKDRVDKFFSI